MKKTMDMIKIILSFVAIIAVVVLAINFTRTRSYSGENLTFAVGGGVVKLDNPSDEAIPVLLVSEGSSSFRLTSSIDEVSGASERVAGDDGIQHRFEFELPSGESELTLSRGTNVNFIAVTDTELSATVSPVSSSSSRNALIAAVVVVLGALYFASSVTNHSLVNRLRGQEVVPPPPAGETLVDHAQGSGNRSYSDNRK